MTGHFTVGKIWGLTARAIISSQELVSRSCFRHFASSKASYWYNRAERFLVGTLNDSLREQLDYGRFLEINRHPKESAALLTNQSQHQFSIKESIAEMIFIRRGRIILIQADIWVLVVYGSIHNNRK